MSPQDAIAFVNKIRELFSGISPTHCEFLERQLEKYVLSTAEIVLEEYAEGTSTFDRAKFLTMVREEHARCAPTRSPTPLWKEVKDAETKTIDESLSKLSKRRLDDLLKRIREKQPEVFEFFRSDPLKTDFGRSLVYAELKSQRSH
jgi:hypothetical protein